MFQDLDFQALLRRKARADVERWRRGQLRQLVAMEVVIVAIMLGLAFWTLSTGKGEQAAARAASDGSKLEDVLERVQAKVG